MTMKFDYSNKIIKNKNNIYYIYDKISKRHIFISDEIMTYLKKAEEFNMDINEFENCFEDLDDKKYIKFLISQLKKIGFLKNSDYNIEVKNKDLKNLESVYIMLTNKCNLKCKHCSTNCSPKEEETLSKDEIKTILSNLKFFNPKNIIFTGGEPLVRDDLEEILKFSKENFKESKFTLSTNATLINNDNLDMIKEFFDKVDVSIDGIDEQTCSIVRGKGVFNKVLENIKLLQKNGMNSISLSMVFSGKNTHLKSRFLELNERLGTVPVERTFNPEGRGYENILVFENEKTHLPKSIPSLYETKQEGSKLSKKISSCSCNAFESNLFIDSYGYAYPCPSLIKDSYQIMNLSDKQYTKEFIISKINETSLKFLPSLEFKGTKCEQCDLNIFCWSCPSNFECAKEFGEINKWCDLMKNNLENIVWG